MVEIEHDDLEKFRMYINQISPISNEQTDVMADCAKKIIFKKNDFHSTPEKPSTYIGFVVKGLFRHFIIDHRRGNEYTCGFIAENMLLASYSAIVLNQFQPIYIQALEDSEILAIQRTDFLKMWENNIDLKNMLQIKTELDCLFFQKRKFSLLLDDAKTRYMDFLEEFHQYADRIKLRYIASYLGITPEALSRIRSENSRVSTNHFRNSHFLKN